MLKLMKQIEDLMLGRAWQIKEHVPWSTFYGRISWYSTIWWLYTIFSHLMPILSHVCFIIFNITLKLVHEKNCNFSLGGIPKSGTFCLLCFDQASSGICSILDGHTTDIRNLVNQNKPNKRFRILVSHPVFLVYILSRAREAGSSLKAAAHAPTKGTPQNPLAC